MIAVVAIVFAGFLPAKLQISAAHASLAAALLFGCIGLGLLTYLKRDIRSQQEFENDPSTQKPGILASKRFAHIPTDVTAPRHSEDIAGPQSDTTEFLKLLNHEIRTPLNGIMGMFELLAISDIPEKQKHQAELGRAACQQLAGLMKQAFDTQRMRHAPSDRHANAANEQVTTGNHPAHIRD